MDGADLLAELRWRGLLHQTSATEDEVRAHLSAAPRVGYCGFDPTKGTLTLGHLLPIMLLRHLQRAGHRPIAVVGGATALIGDPSGKDAERQLLERDQVQENVAGQRALLERFLEVEGSPGAALVLNNAEWLEPLTFVGVLRDIGKHFSVNAMVQRDSIRERLQHREQGISYTEFSYMLLQAYDFLHLKRTHGCSLQLAGSDQYGNIASGIDLIHRVLGREGEQGAAYAITNPLVTRADGKKMGKSEQGAIFLSADLTSPYAFYQYFVNVDDQDAVPLLRRLTLLPRAAIDAVAEEHEKAPERRAAQRELARVVTRFVHGGSEVARVEAASEALFGGDVRSLDERTLAEVFADVPHSEHPRSALEGEGLSAVDLLAQTTLASSKREARQLLESGAIALNGERIGLERRLTGRDLLHGARALLRRGKRQWHATRFVG